jgi:uncharacterized protein (TIGR02678 family)
VNDTAAKRRSRGRNAERFSEELRGCANALLNRPWITKREDPELYQAIKDHYDTLRNWFYEHAGLPLIMTRQFAKLDCIPGSYQPWMGFGSFHTPRDYALFTYGLWYMESKGDAEQFLLSEMVDSIRDHVRTMEVTLDWTVYEHRLSMSRALKKLRELRVLLAVEGDETEWARGGEGNVLYEASPMARYVLRRFPRELMAYETTDALIEPERLGGETEDASEAGSRDADVFVRRQRIFRRLLLEPIIYDEQWTEDELFYVQRQRSWIMQQVEGITGLEGRRFREGLLFAWPELTAESELFPTHSGISDLVLLCSGTIRRSIGLDPYRYERDARGNLMLSIPELEGMLLKLRRDYGHLWSKEHREKTSGALAEELIRELELWNLGGRDGQGAVALYPAMSRWQGEYVWEGGEEA